MKRDLAFWNLCHFWRTLSVVCVIAAVMAFASSPAQAGRIEAGTFTAHDTLGTNRTPDRVTFQEPFDTPPIVIALASSNGGNSASVTITNITTTGFDELIVEPDNWDGRHLAMVTYYIAVEPGRHVLPGGAVIEAGTIPTNAVQFGSGFTGGTANWATVNFGAPLNSVPTILHNLQTANSETNNPAQGPSRPHITSIVQNPSISGFQFAIERSQANSGPFPSNETIGWIALPDGGSGSFPATNGTMINWNAATSAANIRGWDDGCFNNAHGITGSANPIVIAKKITRNNADGGWLRYCSVTGSDISLRVDEDRDQDDERTVAASDAERAAIVAFSTSFHANLRAQLGVTKIRSTVTNNNGSEFHLPQSIVTYLITVRNTGNAPPNEDSVLVTESLPDELDLILADFGGSGNGPVLFSDGTPVTGLNCTFGGFADLTDCFSFSTDGIDFTHEPMDSGDGTDPAVRYVRIEPSGFMNSNTGSGPPNFTLQLRAKLR